MTGEIEEKEKKQGDVLELSELEAKAKALMEITMVEWGQN